MRYRITNNETELHSLLLSVCKCGSAEVFAGRLFQGAFRRRIRFLKGFEGALSCFLQVGVIFDGLHEPSFRVYRA
jgi:hypothetical protein